MNFWKSIAGMVRIRLTSASMDNLLFEITNAGVAMENTVWVNDLTIETTIMRHKLKCVKAVASRAGNELEILDCEGLYWRIRIMRYRPVLLICLVLYIFAVMYIPTCIFFVTVTGNNSVSTERILTEAEQIGVRFGTSKRAIRSEQIKNALN